MELGDLGGPAVELDMEVLVLSFGQDWPHNAWKETAYTVEVHKLLELAQLWEEDMKNHDLIVADQAVAVMAALFRSVNYFVEEVVDYLDMAVSAVAS